MDPVNFLEHMQCEIGIAAVADFAADDVQSDIINMKNYAAVLFLCHWGVGTTGVVQLTVDACDDVSASNTAKVPFYYRSNKAGTHGAVTLADKDTGVSNTAGSNQIHAVLVTAEHLGSLGYEYVRLNVNETTDDPLLGGVLAIPIGARYASSDAATTALT